MPLLVPTVRALKKAAAGAWPDAVGYGIYRAETVNAIPWADLPNQYAAIAVSEFHHFSLGANQIGFSGKVEFYFIGEWGKLGQDDALLGRLDDLLDYLLNNPPPDNQYQILWEEERAMEWGDNIPANEVLASKNSSHRAVRFTCMILIGYCA